jgi:amidase
MAGGLPTLPDLDVFPVDKQLVEVVGGAVQAFEQAGAHVGELRLGIERTSGS